MKDNVTHMVFLDTPAQCRAFLFSLDSPEGKPEGVHLDGGKFLAFTEMCDEEAVFYARQLGDMIDPKARKRQKNENKTGNGTVIPYRFASKPQVGQED